MTRRPQIGATLRSSWLLGALVAVASWNVVFAAPAPGTDGSWPVGLYMAADQGLHFGEQLIYTYGPLGFLSPLSPSEGGIAIVADGGLAQLAFLYGAALQLLLCVSLVWALRRTTGSAAAAVLLTFLLVAGFTAVQRPYVLAAVWCLALLGDQPPPHARRLVVFGGAGLAAIESLIRLNTGPAILVMAGLALAALPSRRRDLATLLGTYLALLTALWFASGQSLGNVGDFVSSAFEVVSGYSQAMASAPAGTKWDLAVVAGVLAVAYLALGGFASASQPRRRLAAALVLGVAGFAVYKEGVVREDESHLGILFATALGLALALPWRPAWRPVAIGGVAGLAALAVATATPPLRAGDFNPLDHADSFQQEFRTLASSARRERLADSARELISNFPGLDPGTLRLLRGHTVHADPSGAAVIWAYELDWRPLPVFQENTAYTHELDQRNVEFLGSEDAPDRILRGTPAAIDPFAPGTIDDRNPAWNPPGVALAMLCRLRALRTTDHWQVLERRADRCGQERSLGSVEAAYGDPVEVPTAGPREAVIARIDGASVSGLERLRSLLFRARLRFAVVNGREATYRLVPGTAEDGLIMSVPARLDLPAPFALSPGARTIELNGAGGELRYDFFALPLR